MIKQGDIVIARCDKQDYSQVRFTVISVFQNVNDKKDKLLYLSFLEGMSRCPRTIIANYNGFEVAPNTKDSA